MSLTNDKTMHDVKEGYSRSIGTPRILLSHASATRPVILHRRPKIMYISVFFLIVATDENGDEPRLRGNGNTNSKRDWTS